MAITLFTDGSYKHQIDEAAYGCVVFNGSSIECGQFGELEANDASEAEFESLIKGLRMVEEEFGKEVVIHAHVDTHEILNSFQNQREMMGIGQMITQTDTSTRKQRLKKELATKALNFNDLQIYKISRDDNKVAHALSRRGYGEEVTRIQ